MKIVQLVNTLSFCERISETKLPIKTAYKINLLKNFIGKDVEFFQNKMNEILSTYGIIENGEFKKDESGQVFLIQPDKVDKCIKEVNDLESIEVDLNGAPRICLDELGNIEITAKELECLMPFIGD